MKHVLINSKYLFFVFLVISLMCFVIKAQAQFRPVDQLPFQQGDYISLHQVKDSVSHYCCYRQVASNSSIPNFQICDTVESELNDGAIWVVDTVWDNTKFLLSTPTRNLTKSVYLTFKKSGICSVSTLPPNHTTYLSYEIFEPTASSNVYYNIACHYIENTQNASAYLAYLNNTWKGNLANNTTYIKVYNYALDSIISNVNSTLNFTYNGGTQTIVTNSAEVIYQIIDRWVEKDNGGQTILGTPIQNNTISNNDLSDIQSVTLVSNSNSRFNVVAHVPTATDTTFATITVGENYRGYADSTHVELNVVISGVTYKIKTIVRQAPNPYADRLQLGQNGVTYPNGVVGVRVQYPITTNVIVPIKQNTNVTITAANIELGNTLSPVNIVSQSNGLELSIPNTIALQQGDTYRVFVDFDYNDTARHHAQIDFLLKVVPQIVMWNGTTNSNWNGDNNWKGVDVGGQVISNGFVPLPTTDVIIAVSNYYPNLTTEVVNAPQDVYFATNSCHNIHFEAHTMMLNQYLLQYNNAWVDLKVPTRKWYLFGSPLVGLFSGDFYIPSAGESVTPYFHVGDVDNRQTYQIWQRLFNKEVTIVSNSNPVHYSVAEWSQNYNALNQSFDTAEGVAMWVHKQNDANVDTVMFRFPKSASSYHYYDSTDNESSSTETITRPSNYGKLTYQCTDTATGEMVILLHNDTVASSVQNTKFLLANPAMANLSLKKFYEGNKGKVSSYGYIMNSTNTATKVGFEVVPISNSTLVLKPGEAVLIKYDSIHYKNPLDTISVVFTPDMFIFEDHYGDAQSTNELSIVANYKGSTSQLWVEQCAEASNNYVEDEDAELLLWSTTDKCSAIYSVADSFAVTKNTLNDVHNTPICFYTSDSVKGTASLLFQGVNSTLYLYDNLLDSYTPLHDSISVTIEVEPTNPIRYFLKTYQEIPEGINDINNNDIQIFTPQSELLVITANCPTIDVDIFTSNGMYIKTLSTTNGIISTTLPQGVYLMTIHHCNSITTHKISIR